MRYEISYSHLNALLFANRHFNEGTPNRWYSISKYISTSAISNYSGPKVLVGENTDNKRSMLKTFMPLDLHMCKSVIDFISEEYHFLLSENLEWDIFKSEAGIERNGFKSIILKPSFNHCLLCNERMVTITKPSFPFIYTENGMYVGASYTSECRNCEAKPRYNVSFYTVAKDERKCRIYYKQCDMKSPAKYFLSSAQTGFSCRYLELCSQEIRVMGASFESLAEVYNSFHEPRQSNTYLTTSNFNRGSGDNITYDLNPTRLEEAWFINRIQGICESEKLEMERNASGLADIEKLCTSMEEKLENVQNKWVLHRCGIKGCEEGYCTIDGNEKLRRSICSEGGEKVINEEGLTVRNVCIEDPTYGGKYKKPGKYCSYHTQQNVECVNVGDETKDIIGRKRTRASYLEGCNEEMVVKMRRVEVEINICKDKKNVNKFYDTSAGMFYAIRPCGIIVSCTEMYTHESLTQAFIFLRNVFCRNSETLSRLSFLGYDRACELKPFIKKLKELSVEGADDLAQSVEYLVDIFHVNKHTKKCCMPLQNNDKCEFHPKLDKFSAIHGTNTESCEQAFKKLNRFKYSTRMMTRNKRKAFFIIINNDHNMHLQEKNKYNKH